MCVSDLFCRRSWTQICGENLNRTSSKRKTVRQAVYGLCLSLWRLATVWGSLWQFSVDCGGLWLCEGSFWLHVAAWRCLYDQLSVVVYCCLWAAVYARGPRCFCLSVAAASCSQSDFTSIFFVNIRLQIYCSFSIRLPHHLVYKSKTPQSLSMRFFGVSAAFRRLV